MVAVRPYVETHRALERAKASKNAEVLRAECVKAVAEWREHNNWPDNWMDWQRALNDAETWPNYTQLDDL